MKRKIIVLISFLVICLHVFPGTIKVGPHHQVSSIRDGIRQASDGDTVWVEAGVYAEKNIVIVKKISLIGDHLPVLDGEKKYEIISVKADGVVVDGFRLINTGVSSLQDIAAIRIYGRRDVVIRNNVLDNTFFGIYVEAGVQCTIEGNRLKAYSLLEQQSGNGIHCWKSDSLRIIDNTISGHRDGIYFEFVTHSVIWRNISDGNLRYGLHFMFSHEDAYISNVFRNNGAGVSVMFTHGVKMFNNYFEDNWGDGAFGMLLKEISDSYVSGNKFLGNTIGVYMEGATRIQFEKNVFRGNGWAMKIQASCMDNVITRNNFLSNTFDIGTNGSLVLNNFDHNYWDKYEGYDLNRDNSGDVPYHPVSLFSMIVERNPPAMMLFRSFMTLLLDKTEKILPGITPANLKDEHPLMKPLKL